jgi:hypothetical protein
MSLRVEVSVFVLSPDIEDRDGVEVATGRRTKRPSTLKNSLYGLKIFTKKYYSLKIRS